MATSKTTTTKTETKPAAQKADSLAEAAKHEQAQAEKSIQAGREGDKAAEVADQDPTVVLHPTGASLEATDDMQAPVPRRADPFADQRKGGEKK